MVKIFIKTFGCQFNIADSEVIAGILKKHYQLVSSESKADFIIINSCSVKNSTQSKILDYIKKYIKNKKIIVGGCLPSSLNLRKIFPEIYAVFNTNSILSLPKIIESKKDVLTEKKESRIFSPKLRKNKDIAIIQISQGCKGSCDFCSAKLARGNLTSYKIQDIKKEFEKAVKEGCNLIYLSSQDNACYGFDLKTNLIKLLKELLKIKGNYQIRIGMMNPGDAVKLLKPLIKIYRNRNIVKFLHIPVQSGSNSLLKKMNRNHGIEEFIKIVKEFRKNIPDITIATDIIVGHPNEKESDFKKTILLIKKISPEVLNISKFSSRPGTRASKLKQLPSQIIKQRSVALSKLYKKLKKRLI